MLIREIKKICLKIFKTKKKGELALLDLEYRVLGLGFTLNIFCEQDKVIKT